MDVNMATAIWHSNGENVVEWGVIRFIEERFVNISVSVDIDKSMLPASSRYDCCWTVFPNQWPCCLINAQILISAVFWISVSQKSSAAVVDSGLKNLKNPETIDARETRWNAFR
jgi:hypothetical protein